MSTNYRDGWQTRRKSISTRQTAWLWHDEHVNDDKKYGSKSARVQRCRENESTAKIHTSVGGKTHWKSLHSFMMIVCRRVEMHCDEWEINLRKITLIKADAALQWVKIEKNLHRTQCESENENTVIKLGKYVCLQRTQHYRILREFFQVFPIFTLAISSGRFELLSQTCSFSVGDLLCARFEISELIIFLAKNFRGSSSETNLFLHAEVSPFLPVIGFHDFHFIFHLPFHFPPTTT